MRCETIALIFACAVCHHFVSTSANSVKKEDDTKSIFTKLISKFGGLINKVDKLEAQSSTGNIKIQQLLQENQIFENRFEKIEDRLIKMKKCENVPIKLRINWNACEPNPCNGGRCEVLPDGIDYRCTHCPAYAEGKNCEILKCDPSDKCFKRNDKVYVVFETKLNWEEANLKCWSEGMTLAQPKDEASTKFIVDQLRPLYDYSVANQFVLFWIGLKYNEIENEYQWTDGSSLGDYTGGWTGFKMFTSGRCGVMFLNGGSTFWLNVDCSNFAKMDILYPVCEKRISVF